MTVNSSLRTLTSQQRQRHNGLGASYGASAGKLFAAAAGVAGGVRHEDAPGSAVGQLLSKPTVMDSIKQVRPL
jgi:hypothetical protein